jgi:hypothetical protein
MGLTRSFELISRQKLRDLLRHNPSQEYWADALRTVVKGESRSVRASAESVEGPPTTPMYGRRGVQGLRSARVPATTNMDKSKSREPRM